MKEILIRLFKKLCNMSHPPSDLKKTPCNKVDSFQKSDQLFYRYDKDNHLNDDGTINYSYVSVPDVSVSASSLGTRECVLWKVDNGIPVKLGPEYLATYCLVEELSEFNYQVKDQQNSGKSDLWELTVEHDPLLGNCPHSLIRSVRNSAVQTRVNNNNTRNKMRMFLAEKFSNKIGC